MNGKLIIFSGPSGAGKTTIVKHLLKSNFKLEFSVSCCSRPKRNDEIYGKDYYFLSIENFKKKIKNDEFIEWEEVYKGSFYGTLKSEIKRIWENGNNVIFDVDVIGGLNIKKIYREKALSVFVMPPSVKILEERLRQRSTEKKHSLQKRLDKANLELSYAENFDEIIINDNLETAVEEAKKVVSNFLNIKK